MFMPLTFTAVWNFEVGKIFDVFVRNMLKFKFRFRFICHIHDYTESINQQWNVSQVRSMDSAIL